MQKFILLSALLCAVQSQFVWKIQRTFNLDYISEIPVTLTCSDVEGAIKLQDGRCLCPYDKIFHVGKEGLQARCYDKDALCDEGSTNRLSCNLGYGVIKYTNYTGVPRKVLRIVVKGDLPPCGKFGTRNGTMEEWIVDKWKMFYQKNDFVIKRSTQYREIPISEEKIESAIIKLRFSCSSSNIFRTFYVKILQNGTYLYPPLMKKPDPTITSSTLSTTLPTTFPATASTTTNTPSITPRSIPPSELSTTMKPITTKNPTTMPYVPTTRRTTSQATSEEIRPTQQPTTTRISTKTYKTSTKTIASSSSSSMSTTTLVSSETSTPSSLANTSNDSDNGFASISFIVLGVVIGVIVIMVISIIVCILKSKRRKKRKRALSRSSTKNTYIFESDFAKSNNQKPDDFVDEEGGGIQEKYAEINPESYQTLSFEYNQQESYQELDHIQKEADPFEMVAEYHVPDDVMVTSHNDTSEPFYFQMDYSGDNGRPNEAPLQQIYNNCENMEDPEAYSYAYEDMQAAPRYDNIGEQRLSLHFKNSYNDFTVV